jgi:hypothetical protein
VTPKEGPVVVSSLLRSCLQGSGTPLRGAGQSDAVFRWSFPLCPERPPASGGSLCWHLAGHMAE